MEESIKINYLTINDLYELQDKTGMQILYDGTIDEVAFSEAVRTLIRRIR